MIDWVSDGVPCLMLRMSRSEVAGSRFLNGAIPESRNSLGFV